MGILKRAWLYISRKRARAASLFVVMFVSAVLTISAFAVNSAASDAARYIRSSLGGYFKVTERSGNQPTDDTFVSEVMSSANIKTYNGLDYIELVSDLALIPGRFGGTEDERGKTVRMYGNTDSSLNEYYLMRSFVLTEGRHIDEKDNFKAVISKELAQMNGLGIGDAVAFRIGEQLGKMNPQSTGTPFSFEIVGIFEIEESLASADTGSLAEADIPANYVFTDTTALRTVRRTLTGSSTSRYNGGVMFFAENPEDLYGIIDSIQQNADISWQELEISVNDKAYRDAIIPLERISGFSTVLVIVLIIISISLLSLILFMHIRSRSREMGIYLSLGIRKAHILLQLLAENLILSIIALITAFLVTLPALGAAEEPFIRALSGSPLTESILELSVGTGETAIIAALCMITVVVSVGIASGFILRTHPKNILSESH